VDGDEFKKIYGLEGTAPIILFVGRLNYQKGLRYLLAAMPTVLSRFKGAKLVIVGGGEQFVYLQNLSESLGVKNSVIFTGEIPHERITDAFAAADILVLPSIFESFGIVLIEAQAMGKPVVCTRVGGVPEALIEKETGIIVEPRRPDQLAEAIISILSNPKMAKSMGEKGRKFVEENFDWQKTVSKIVEIYELM
jgi:glycosyltransferase involved in cell wall biosynthesis